MEIRRRIYGKEPLVPVEKMKTEKAVDVAVRAPTRKRTGVDARILRTQEQLRLAVLDIAENHEINGVSVTTLARMAKINRTTFYQHATSPAALLTQVLTQEIADIAQTHMVAILADPGDMREPLWIGMRALVDYLVSREGIYRRHLRSAAPSMHGILAGQIEKAALLLFKKEVLGAVSNNSVAWSIAASHYAHGVAAALLKWLDHGPPYDRDLLEKVLEAGLPAWYPPHA